ncbi:hypothetical protein YC2023_086204 [Brassica napus]
MADLFELESAMTNKGGKWSKAIMEKRMMVLSNVDSHVNCWFQKRQSMALYMIEKRETGLREYQLSHHHTKGILMIRNEKLPNDISRNMDPYHRRRYNTTRVSQNGG